MAAPTQHAHNTTQHNMDDCSAYKRIGREKNAIIISPPCVFLSPAIQRVLIAMVILVKRLSPC